MAVIPPGYWEKGLDVALSTELPPKRIGSHAGSLLGALGMSYSSCWIKQAASLQLLEISLRLIFGRNFFKDFGTAETLLIFDFLNG